MHWQREHWLQLMEPLNQQLLETMAWFKEAKQRRCLYQAPAHPSRHRLADFALPGALAATSQPLSQYPQSGCLCGLRSGGTFLSRAQMLSGDQ